MFRWSRCAIYFFGEMLRWCNRPKKNTRTHNKHRFSQWTLPTRYAMRPKYLREFWKIISRPIFRQRALSSATQTLGLMQFCVSVVGRRVPLCRFRIQIQRRWIDRELLYRIHLVTMRLFFFRARARAAIKCLFFHLNDRAIRV